MNEQKNTEMTWWERNKKKVLTIGGVVIAVGIGIVVFKNKDALIEFMKKEKMTTKSVPQNDEQLAIQESLNAITALDIDSNPDSKTINNGNPFKVITHIRNLSNGRCPSAEKRKEAENLGIHLGEHQTFVNEYIKNAS